jgi:RNase adaptor protein for sRNA GlmZ degradation
MNSGSGSAEPLHIILFSFGFKFGIPEDVNMLWDVRFLPNPYWVESMRARSGQEKDVADYVVESPAGQEFLRLMKPLLLFLVQKNQEALKTELRLGVGCTGGKHRSVAVVEALRLALQEQPVQLTIFHRDIDKG